MLFDTSEETAECDSRIKFISGFSGSNALGPLLLFQHQDYPLN